MTPRKTATQIDPVAVTAAALKRIKNASDYHQLGNTSPNETLTAAWNTLSESDQQRITNIINDDTPATPQLIADELTACGAKLQLAAIKAHHGELAVKQAWKLLSGEERSRLTSICQNQSTEETEVVTEKPATYQVEQPAAKRTLFSISDDLLKLNDLLDQAGDDAEQQNLIAQWFDTLGEERDQKLDGYAALITEMIARASVRKAEAQRLMELAATDENRAKLLRDRLKWFFQMHDLKTINTDRYRLSVVTNGGKLPLVLDESVPVTHLPEQFQQVSINFDKEAIRSALEAGEILPFAHFGERGESLRIK